MSKPFKLSGDQMLALAIKLRCEIPGDHPSIGDALREVIIAAGLVQKELDAQEQESATDDKR